MEDSEETPRKHRGFTITLIVLGAAACIGVGAIIGLFSWMPSHGQEAQMRQPTAVVTQSVTTTPNTGIEASTPPSDPASSAQTLQCANAVVAATGQQWDVCPAVPGAVLGQGCRLMALPEKAPWFGAAGVACPVNQ